MNFWLSSNVKIDYTKLVDRFGSKLIDDDLMHGLEALTIGQGRVPFLHRFLRRNIFFSHRELTALLDCVERGRHIYLYPGRGPSSAAMHFHTVVAAGIRLSARHSNDR